LYAALRSQPATGGKGGDRKGVKKGVAPWEGLIFLSREKRKGGQPKRKNFFLIFQNSSVKKNGKKCVEKGRGQTPPKMQGVKIFIVIFESKEKERS